MTAFSGLFLLKMANLFPAELDLGQITVQVEQLAQLLSDVAAERYALTLRIMLANLRRKVGLTASGIPDTHGFVEGAAGKQVGLRVVVDAEDVIGMAMENFDRRTLTQYVVNPSKV